MKNEIFEVNQIKELAKRIDGFAIIISDELNKIKKEIMEVKNEIIKGIPKTKFN